MTSELSTTLRHRRAFAALWIVIIWSVVPIAADLRQEIADAVPLAGAVAAAVALLLAVPVLRALRKLSKLRIAMLVVSLLVTAFLLTRIRLEVEGLHVLSYSVLTVLLVRCSERRDGLFYFEVWCKAALIAVVDETLQWWTPGRFGLIEDIVLDLEIVLVTIVFALILNTRRTPTPQRIRIAQAQGIAVVLALVAFHANTPDATSALARSLPGFSHLTLERSTIMSEYGHRFETEVGTYTSRFDAEELVALDAYYAAETLHYAPRMRARNDRWYRASPFRDPFLFELRTHVFYRDRYLQRATFDPDDRDRLLDHAAREQAILERHYAATLAAHRRSNNPRLVDGAMLPATQYVSEVSDWLIVDHSRRAALLVGILLIALLLIVPPTTQRLLRRRRSSGATHNVGAPEP